jgi:diguanylate cyclase (GGDEF)-like protein
LIASAVVFGVLAVGAPWWPYQSHAIATSVTGLLFPFIAVAGGVQGLRRGRRSARFFLLAWGILLVGTAMLAARNLGLVPTTGLTRYAMQIGSALEMLLLSFALAERITDLRRGKETAEQSAVRARREMVDALRRTEVELEQRVEARTQELKALNRELSSQRERLEVEARRDPLTGLANRSLLESALADAVSAAERGDEVLALLFIDLDEFKPVNDLHGHSTGDALLQVIAGRIRNCVRTKDTVARFGGDEFVVAMTGVQAPSVVIATAERIIARISRPVEIGALRVQLSASIGVAIFPGDGDRPSALIRAADQAMYEAKHLGRGRVATTQASATWLASALAADGADWPASGAERGS